MGPTLRTISILLLVATGLGAQELTLGDAVSTALEDNPEVAAARERSAAAGERSEQARGYRLPELNLSETFIYSNNPAEVFALTLNQGRFDMDEFFLSDPNNPDPLSTWVTSAELVMPIYTGGKLSARVDQAGAMSTAGELEYRHTRERIAFEAIAAFINLAKAREHVALLQKTRATTAEHVRIAEEYSAQGIILEADLLQSKVFLSEMDDMVTTAVNGERLAQAALNFSMGADQSLPRTLATVPPPPPVIDDLGSLIAAALTDRRDLAAARKQLEAGRLEEKAHKPGYLPEVAVRGHYDLYDDTIFGANGHSGSIMAFAKINVFSGGSNSSARAAARHQTASFEADIRRFEEGVRLEVRQAWQDLETARTRHATASASVTAAAEALRVRESRFRQGLDKMIDLLSAQTDFREAEMRELVARYEVALGTHRLRYVSGASLIEGTEDNR